MINKTDRPLVSVILPVHNGEMYVGQAIQSILDQTYKNIELLILISATTNEESLNIIKSFTDDRIRRIMRKPNDNLPMGLNLGIREAKGKYIARMDNDDISLPQRIETQVAFMELHPDIGMSGTWYRSFGTGGTFVNKLYTDSDDIKASLLFNTSFCHPTMIFRRNVLEQFNLRYNETLSWGEDYEFWSRCVDHFPVANIDKILLMYRVHKQSASNVFKQQTSNTAFNVREKLLRKIGLDPSLDEIRLHNSLKPTDNESIDSFLDREESWLIKIIRTNDISHVHNTDSLNKIIYKRWKTICGFNTGKGIQTWNKFRSSKLFKLGTGKRRTVDCTKLFVKSLLKR